MKIDRASVTKHMRRGLALLDLRGKNAHGETAPNGDRASVGSSKTDEAAAAKEPAPAGPVVLRSAAAAVKFCDRFTAGEQLPAEGLTQKLALMRCNPLKLARCMPALMMSDIVQQYWPLAKLSDKPAPVIWLCGDAHYGNFGVIRGADGWAAWGVNDYDMTCKGSPAMDLDRLAFSLVSQMRTTGIDGKHAPEVVDKLVKAYLAEMADIARHGAKPAYLTAEELKKDANSGKVGKMVAKSNDVKRPEWLGKYAKSDGKGNWSWVYGDKIDKVNVETAKKVTDALHEYDSRQGTMDRVKRPLEVPGVAQKKQSGGSSHGQLRYFALVADADKSKPPLIIEVKQELPPPLAGWDGNPSHALARSRCLWTGNLHKADAEQVVDGQTACGGCPNPITGYTEIDGISYLVREREQYKAALCDTDLTCPDDFLSLAAQAGKALARAHGRGKETAQAILDWAGDEKTFSANLDKFANVYADQATADWEAFCQAHPDDGTPVPPEDPFHVLGHKQAS